MVNVSGDLTACMVFDKREKDEDLQETEKPKEE
jgi:hypothetical protein